MPWMFERDGADSPEGVLTAAIRRYVCGRLEQAMYDDEVIAEFLSNSPATVVLDVVVDRDLGEGELTYEVSHEEDAPWAPAIGQPAVVAVVTMIRERILRREASGRADSDEPMVFEIAIQPDMAGRRTA